MTIRRRLDRLASSMGNGQKPPRVALIQVIDAFASGTVATGAPQERIEFSVLWRAGEWCVVSKNGEGRNLHDRKP